MFHRGSLVSYDGTCTAGATAQDILAANKSRRFIFFQNISDTTMYLNFAATATADHIPVAAGASIRFDIFVPTGKVSMLCATTGKKFVCRQG